MNHFTSARFWEAYSRLPVDFRFRADKQFALLKENPSHPSLHFKKTGRFWSARVNDSMRALAVESGGDLVWFWIGDHRAYELLINRG